MTDEEIYHQAATLDATQQEAFLNQACGNDSDRFRRLKCMLSAAGKRDELLDTEAMASDTPAEPAGRRQIGDFHVGRLLGRGGMGEVYEAKVDDPKWLPWFPPNSSAGDHAVVPSAYGIGQQSSSPTVSVRE